MTSRSAEHVSAATGEWKHDLCACGTSCSLCCITCYLPCYTAGKVAEAVDEPCLLCGLLTAVPIVGQVFGALVRRKVRDRQKIAGTLPGDLCAWFCCPCCALTQEALEVDAFGYHEVGGGGEKGVVGERTKVVKK